MFSVVVPLFNKQDCIKETLQSVLNQTYEDFEIIVVNDGSTDQSVKIVENIFDSRIRIVNQSNCGVSSARNRGIFESKSEFIAFLDADDLWEPTKLARANKVLKYNSNINWLFHSYKKIVNNLIIEVTYSKEGILSNVFNDFVDGIRIHTSSVIVRKIFLTENFTYPFAVGISNSEDRELWYKLSCLDPNPYYINSCLSSYVIDKTGTSLTHGQIFTPKGFHFLSMEFRIKEFISVLNESNKIKIVKHIKRFNSNAIINYWIASNIWSSEFYPHLPNWLFFIMNSLQKLHPVIKRPIGKLFKYIL